MAIEVSCAACGRSFKVADDFAGRHGRCPHCQAVVRAPQVVDFDIVEEPSAAADPGAPVDLARDDWHTSADSHEQPPPPAPPQPETASTPPLIDARVASRRLRRAPSGSLDALAAGEQAPAPAEHAANVLPNPMEPIAPNPPEEAAPAPAEPAFPGAVSRRSPKVVARAARQGRSRKKRHKLADEEGNWSNEVWQMVIVTALGFLLLGLVLAGVLMRGGPENDTLPVATNPVPTRPGTPQGSAPAPPGPAELPLPPVLARDWPKLREGLVRVKIGDRTVNGFVLDANGLVLVRYRDVVDTEFENVTMQLLDLNVPIEGAVAASALHNMVLLRVEGPLLFKPTALELTDTMPEAEQRVFAAYIPPGKSSSAAELAPLHFAETLPTENMPQAELLVLHDWGIESGETLRWIETLEAPPAAADGGPLLDEEGRVLGVVMRLDASSPCGYALDASHILELVSFARDEALPLDAASLAELQADLEPIELPGDEAPSPEPAGDEGGSVGEAPAVRGSGETEESAEEQGAGSSVTRPPG